MYICLLITKASQVFKKLKSKEILRTYGSSQLYTFPTAPRFDQIGLTKMSQLIVLLEKKVNKSLPLTNTLIIVYRIYTLGRV